MRATAQPRHAEPPLPPPWRAKPTRTQRSCLPGGPEHREAGHGATHRGEALLHRQPQPGRAASTEFLPCQQIPLIPPLGTLVEIHPLHRRGSSGTPHRGLPSSAVPMVKAEDPTQWLPQEEAGTKGAPLAQWEPRSPHPTSPHGTRHPATPWHGDLAPWGQQPPGTGVPIASRRARLVGSAGTAAKCLWSHQVLQQPEAVLEYFCPASAHQGPARGISPVNK